MEVIGGIATDCSPVSDTPEMTSPFHPPTLPRAKLVLTKEIKTHPSLRINSQFIFYL